MSHLTDIIKQIALDELKSKGYAPNPADVHGIASKVAELVAEEVEKAIAEVKANQSSTFPSPSMVTQPAEVKVAPPTT